MHRTGPSWRHLFPALTLLLAACVPFPTPEAVRAEVRRVYVTEPTGATTEELRRCGEVAHDAAVRRLALLGYDAVAEPVEADATLEGYWEVAGGGQVADPLVVGLRLRLLARSGEVLFTTEVIPRTRLSFLSPDRVREDVAARLAQLGRAPDGRGRPSGPGG